MIMMIILLNENMLMDLEKKNDYQFNGLTRCVYLKS